MQLKLPIVIISGTACILMSTAFYATAQHDSPKPATGRFIKNDNLDLTIKPGDDFYNYANGNWIKNNKIPAKESSWGSFNVLINDNTQKLNHILTEVSTAPAQPKGSLKQRVGDLYASGMDTLAIEKRGYAPIKPDLQRVDQISSFSDVVNEVLYDKVNSVASPLFALSVDQDAKYPSKHIVDFGQGGTTMPDRDYYLKDDARTKKIQAAYHQYQLALFTLTGTSAEEAEKNANIVFNIEKKLATAQWSRVELRDPNKTYNKFSIADFSKTTPHLNWVELLPKLKINGQDSLLVDEPSYFKAMDSVVAAVPVSEWKVYLKWNVLKTAASYLSSPFVKANFAYSSALSGQKVQKPRNERMAGTVDRTIGELLGQLYVEKYFPPEAKKYMLTLVNNLKAAFADRIQNLDWMSAETKVRALKKLNAITVKIAYPDKWEKYEGVVINRDDYAGNIKRIAQWGYRDNIGQLGKPVDKTKWGMTPPTVNAYYNPVNNEIVFPAGILQFPFFNYEADDAINYGAIGSGIGHEMTHGFDDEGRQFDADGSLHDWWTKEDAEKFQKRADLVVAQYNKYAVLDTVHINGKLTLGENIADLGGLNMAYAAFKKTKEGQSNQLIDGFTPDQRFFLAFAQVWRGSQRPEVAAQMIVVDPHSPAMFRINGPITNVDAWYKAFNIQPGNKLYIKPEDRIKIW